MNKPQANLESRRFGRLTVASFSRSDQHRNRYWNCQCDCGTLKEVAQKHLRAGKTISCGCWKDQQTKKRSITHGQSKTPEYRIWAKMIQRCANPNDPGYYKYGARGIRVCDRWLDFANFFEDMGHRPSSNHSLERIDNDGYYEPLNVKWATVQEQANNRRSSKRVTFQGETLTVAEWARRTGIDYSAIQYRLNSGWPVDKALTQTSRPHKPFKAL